MVSETPLRSRRKKYARIASLAVLLIGMIGLSGSVFDTLARLVPIGGFTPMRPFSAVLFIATALILLISLRVPTHRAIPGIGWIVGIVVALIGCYIVGAHAFGFSTFTDNFLINSGPNGSGTSNRMPWQTGMSFVFLGIAIAFTLASKKWARIGEGLSMFLLIMTYGIGLGMLFESSSITGGFPSNTMSVLSWFSFMLIGTSLLAFNRDGRFVGLFSTVGVGGQTARLFIPTILIVPALVGWLRVIGQDNGLYETAFGTAISIFTLVLLMFVIVVFFSAKVSATDAERQKAEAELARREERYRELFDYSQGIICIHDINGRIETINPAALATTGYERSEIEGRELSEFLPESERSGIAEFLREIEHRGLSHGLLPIVAKDGRVLAWRYQSILVTEAGREPYVIGHAVDVTELVEAQRELKSLSLTDELTGLLNRRGFLNLAEQQLRLERHAGTARGLALMFADMDGLKKINDRLGHEAGSDAIATLARIVKSVVRNGDLVARWGGDEFVILTIGAADENIKVMSERIETSLDEYNLNSGKPYIVACSIGVAPVILNDRSFEEIIAEADEAMYEEKKKRKLSRAIIAPMPTARETDQGQDSFAWY